MKRIFDPEQARKVREARDQRRALRAETAKAVMFIKCPDCGVQTPPLSQRDVNVSPNTAKALLAQTARDNLALCPTKSVMIYRQYAGKEPEQFAFYDRK
jgi:hypothetical protein